MAITLSYEAKARKAHSQSETLVVKIPKLYAKLFQIRNGDLLKITAVKVK